jgi:hypothetical protein
MTDQSKPLLITSMFGQHGQVPLVVLTLGEEVAQLGTDKARQIAGWLWECAEAAEQDAFIHHFATVALGLDEMSAAQFMGSYRAYRSHPRHEETVGE